MGIYLIEKEIVAVVDCLYAMYNGFIESSFRSEKWEVSSQAKIYLEIFASPAISENLREFSSFVLPW